jgi:hypothetical protein
MNANFMDGIRQVKRAAVRQRQYLISNCCLKDQTNKRRKKVNLYLLKTKIEQTMLIWKVIA